MNKITVLTNNVILIGDTTDTMDGIIVQKPHSIQNNGQDYILTPFLEELIGQNIGELSLKTQHVLASVEAENNGLLQAYLEKISGIVIPKQEILLG